MTREDLIEKNMPLVKFIISKYFPKYVGTDLWEDIFQVGCVGLVEAVDRFDSLRGTEFSTFASATIWGEIKRYERLFSHAITIPRKVFEDMRDLTETERDEILRRVTPISLDEVVRASQDGDFTILDALEDKSVNVEQDVLSGILRTELLSELSVRDRVVAESIIDGASQVAAAKLAGISQPHVSRIMRKFRVCARRQLV